MIKVSIVVAAFNVEQYIREAIGSLLAQTLREIEIVIVDDCSTDGTPAILAQLAATDERIKVIRHETNKSAMQVRKTGVAHATGEYVMFLDGDDLLSANACERAYEAIMCEGVDLLQFDTTLFSEDPIGKETEENLLAYLRSVDRKVETDSPAGLLDRETIGGNVNFTVWNKIYRRALLVTVNEQIPDEYLNISEDILFSYLVQYFAKSFSYLPAALHKYRFGTGISTSSEVSDQKLEANAKSAFVYSYLRDWTEQRGHADRCEEVLSWIGKQIRTNVGVNYFFRVDKQQRAAFLKTVLRRSDTLHGDKVLPVLPL